MSYEQSFSLFTESLDPFVNITNYDPRNCTVKEGDTATFKATLEYYPYDLNITVRDWRGHNLIETDKVSS